MNKHIFLGVWNKNIFLRVWNKHIFLGGWNKHIFLGVWNAGWKPDSRETSQTQANSRISQSSCYAGTKIHFFTFSGKKVFD